MGPESGTLAPVSAVNVSRIDAKAAEALNATAATVSPERRHRKIKRTVRCSVGAKTSGANSGVSAWRDVVNLTAACE